VQTQINPGAPFVAPKPRHAPLPPDVSAASFMRVPAVAMATGAAISTIWTWARQGKFPEPVRFGRITAWRSSDVTAFLADPAGWRATHSVGD